jgi:ATP phosphoribosyltransferase regulatory subunit HisZ
VVLGFAGALDDLLLAADCADSVELAELVARRERGEVRRACRALLSVVENGVPDRPEDLGTLAADRLQRLITLRTELAASYPGALLTIDLAEFARNGLDPRLAAAGGDRPYYDGMVFHAYAGPAALPVGGGGRYDRLFRALGAEVPAVGFSLSLERLLEAAP